MPNDTYWMNRAIALARTDGRQAGNNPIACVIVRDGEVLAESVNQVAALHDPTAHAEIMAIRHAGATLQCHELRGATLYTTLQPCGMCTMACIWAKIGRIVFGAGRNDVHSMYFEDRHLDTVDFIRDAFRNDLALTGGVAVRECAALYTPPDADVPPARQVNR